MALGGCQLVIKGDQDKNYHALKLRGRIFTSNQAALLYILDKRRPAHISLTFFRTTLTELLKLYARIYRFEFHKADSQETTDFR